MKTLALIPARGGSKRLPGKNIMALGGKPLIAHTIEAALQAQSVDRVVVSTDDGEIAGVARAWGAELPFMRPAELALDTTPDRPVLAHALDWLEENEGESFDFLVLLRPTTPFKTPELIDRCVKRLAEDSKCTAVRTVSRAEGVFHPYWMFRNEEGRLRPFIDGISLGTYYQSQLLPECYRLNGVVDVLRAGLIRGGGQHFGEDVGFVETEEEQSIDIDTPFDFELCEFLIERKKT